MHEVAVCTRPTNKGGGRESPTVCSDLHGWGSFPTPLFDYVIHMRKACPKGTVFSEKITEVAKCNFYITKFVVYFQ
jgi:hypothetical protein